MKLNSRYRRQLLVSLCLLLLFVLCAHGQPRQPRQISLTFDDLPASRIVELAQLRQLTDKLLKTLQRARVPIIGFVNEGKLHQADNSLAARTALLERWLKAGFELGNHTYSHIDMNRATTAQFEQDLLAGEAVTRQLLAARQQTPRYFRHPFLHTGKSLAQKAAFEQILANHQYTIAPVTIDNSEWIFAAVYEDALKRQDHALAKRVVAAYVPYMEAVVAFYEKQSQTLLGYEIKQILLVHANMLNADHFDKILTMLKKRGYQIVSLTEALRDPAYQAPAYQAKDGYVGNAGISWLQRWAITQQHQATKALFKEEPQVPAFVEQAMKQVP